MGLLRRYFGRRDTVLLSAVLLLQGLCLVFLVSEELFEFSTDNRVTLYNQIVDSLEILVMLGLVSGFLITLMELRKLMVRMAAADRQLGVARGVFHEVLQSHFDEWRLTPAQRDVALLAVKGLTNAEIADVRNTKEGTIKAQLNSVYAKAGVSGRSQFIGLFVEELMAGPVDASSQDQTA